MIPMGQQIFCNLQFAIQIANNLYNSNQEQTNNEDKAINYIAV